MKPMLIIAAVTSLCAYVVIGFYANWQTAIAVYVIVFMASLDKDLLK